MFELTEVKRKSKIWVKKLENKFFFILYRVILNKIDDNFYTLKEVFDYCLLYSLSTEMIINVAF